MSKFKKVKLVGGSLVIQAKRQQGKKGPAGNSVEVYNDPVHSDLEEQLSNLRVHYGCLSGVINGKKLNDPLKVKAEQLEQFRVTGYFYKGKNDEQIGLTGMMKMENGKWSSMTVPPRTIESEENPYEHMDAMLEVIEDLNSEVELFLKGEKMGVKQGELEMPDAEPDKEDKTEE